MSTNAEFIQEIEQAVIEKQNLLSSLSKFEINPAERTQINQKIQEIDKYLVSIANQNNSSSTTSQNPTPSLNDLNLQAKVTNLQSSLEAQIAQNQNLQAAIQNLQKNGISAINPNLANQISGYVNTNYGQTSAGLTEKIINNASKITGIKPTSLRDYLYLGWDYLVRDRLPKLLSTRLWLVVGGSYITEMLGQDTTLKIVSIVLLVVFYVVSEVIVKMSSDMAKSKEQSPRFY
jgi:ribosome-associated translation inhibitor RaiA